MKIEIDTEKLDNAITGIDRLSFVRLFAAERYTPDYDYVDTFLHEIYRQSKEQETGNETKD